MEQELFGLVIRLETVPVLVETQMNSTLGTEDVAEVTHAVFASLSGFPCGEMMETIFPDIRRHSGGFPLAGRGR